MGYMAYIATMQQTGEHSGKYQVSRYQEGVVATGKIYTP
jgi:hypothetical protein